MAEPPPQPGHTIWVTVRYFAAAQEAAGVDVETVPLPASSTLAELCESLAARNSPLAEVLRRCSYLRQGVAVRALNTTLSCGDIVDVLPPFSGG